MPFIVLTSLLLSILCIGYISGVGADGTAFVSLNNNNIQQIAHRHHHTAVALKKGGTKKKKVQSSIITVNKLAFRNYEVLETWEAGISLVGTEVKRLFEYCICVWYVYYQSSILLYDSFLIAPVVFEVYGMEK